MATSAAEIEFIPDEQIDFIPDEVAATDTIDFIPDEVVAQEAQKASAGALQAVDVMAAPSRFDWSDVNEKLDTERFIEAQDTTTSAAEKFRLGQISEPEMMAAYRKSDQLRADMSPFTTAGQARDQRVTEVAAQAQRDASNVTTPSEALSRFLGPSLASTTQPVIESAARNLGGASGGAIGAALAGAATVGTGGVAPLLFGIGGALMGSQAGGAAQEAVLKSTETPEETEARHQREAQDVARNPGLAKLGAIAANAPFFGPSLAQFGRAAAGDAGAIANLGIAGTIGGSLEVLNAAREGRFATAQDIAEGVFANLIMNEPTRLGRRIGLHPSSEQLAEEAAAMRSEQAPIPIPSSEKTNVPKDEIDVLADLAEKLQQQLNTPIGVPEIQTQFRIGSQRATAVLERLKIRSEEQPTTTNENAQQISETGTPDGGVRAPEVPSADALVPADESGEGVQPSGQGRPLAENAPEAPRKIATLPNGEAKPLADLSEADTPVIAFRTRDGRLFADPNSRIHFQAASEFGKALSREKSVEPGFVINGEFYPGSQDGRNNPTAIMRRIRAKKEAAPAVLSDEARIAKLVEAGMSPEDAAAGLARLKAAEAPPVPPAGEPPAPPAETVEPPQATSIKNAVTAEERAARGIPPAEEPARRAFGEVWDAVKAEVANNPATVDGLVAQLKEKARPLTDREDALLLHRQIDLQRSFDDAAAELNRAAEAGDEPIRAEAEKRLDGARKALQELYDIGKQAGTETARGLAARKMMANQDFTLAAMETRLRAEQGGVPLTPEQQATVKQQADTIAKTQAEMDKIIAERDALKAQVEADKAVDPKVKSLADRIIARLDLSAANAAKSLRSRLGDLNNFVPDPLIVLDVAKIAAAKTAKKAIEFAQWSAEMVKDFGEKVRPFLQAGWDQREQFIDAEVGSAVGTKTRKVRSEAEKQESAVEARLTSLANRTAEYERRAKVGDFSPMRKPALDLSKNPEWVKLKAENEKAKADYEKARYEARKAQRTTQQKIRDTVADVWSASRPILASTDISAPGRQGIFFSLPDLFTNPVRLGRQMRTMFRSQFSESKFHENEAAIKSRENADLYEESGLYLADIDHKPSAREEQFKSELAEKIPGVGRIVRGSARGFSSFMNTVRADAMDAFVKWSGGREKVNPDTAKFLAAAINDLSGRGNVSSRQAQGALEWLAKYLFSPRLWVSRFNTAVLKPIWRDPLNRAITPRARAVVAGQYAKFVGAVAAMRFLGQMAGMSMDLDPRSSDFGKLKIGTKRYDIMGGIGNMVTLLARIATQKTKDDKGKLLRIAWQDEKRPERELGQILFNHLRNKAAPIPGAVYDFIYGRHPDRSKVTVGSMLKQTTVPITVSDTAGYFKQDSPAAALRDTLINALGVTVNDYRK